MISKKTYETIGEKIVGYESVVRFYERNPDGRFQTKSNLRRIADEINLDLSKDWTKNNSNKFCALRNRIAEEINSELGENRAEDNSNKLYSLQKRIEKFI